MHVETSPYFSLSRIIRAVKPKEELENELIACLSVQLRRLRIRWNPRAFRAALNNPTLPEELLRKLEDFLSVAETLRWSLPKTFTEELNRLVEDIESYNPAFVKSLTDSRASGRVPASVVKRRLGL